MTVSAKGVGSVAIYYQLDLWSLYVQNVLGDRLDPIDPHRKQHRGTLWQQLDMRSRTCRQTSSYPVSRFL